MRRPKSDETKALISQAHKGKTLSAETKARISEVRSGENNPMFGRIHSIETITKMSETKLGSNNPRSKKVYVYSNYTPTILSHEFVSYSEAAKHFSCNKMFISRALGGVALRARA